MENTMIPMSTITEGDVMMRGGNLPENAHFVGQPQPITPTPKIVAAAILSLDDRQMEHLSVWLSDYRRLRTENDKSTMEYLSCTLLEIFTPASGESIDIEEWLEKNFDPQVLKEARDAVQREREEFFDKYQGLKVKSGLNTYKKLADAAGISVTTIQQIEKRRIKPQFRTIEKLAKAFGVDPIELLGDGGAD
jgi:transcriptional regulator with XRE-family HTH domain